MKSMVLRHPCTPMCFINTHKESLLNSATLEPTEQQTATPQNNPTAATPAGLPVANEIRFTDFNISDSLKSRLSNAGFVTPTPVHAKTSPPALAGQALLATASRATRM